MGKVFDRGPVEAAELDFDRVADDYWRLHSRSIAASGEAPEYFARYKRDVLARILSPAFSSPLLDFGCGIGTLTACLAETFPLVHAYDPSSKCLDRARGRAPDVQFYASLDEVPRAHFGAVVLANVLHHVAMRQRAELVGVAAGLLGAGGRLVVFEHNPLNPLTRRAVAACPFDEGVELLSAREATTLLRGAGLARPARRYIVFFPRALKVLRRLERTLGFVPLGAQVVAWATKE